MFRTLALSALAAGALLTLDARASGSTSDYVLTVPETIGTGAMLSVTLEAPVDSPAIMLVSLNPGPTPLPFGDLCISFPTVLSLSLLIPGGVPLESTCQIPCDPNFVGIVSYWQFMALDPGTRQLCLSNCEVMTVVDELCQPNVLWPEEADRDPTYGKYSGGHSVWMFGEKYVFVDGGQYTEDPGTGMAALTGVVAHESDADDQWSLNICFDGLVNPSDASYPPAGSPKLELHSTAYTPDGPVDPATWRYYTVTKGSMMGLADNAGCIIDNITRVGPSFQVGDGASGKNLLFGASGWWTGTLGGDCDERTVHGDFNIDLLADCPQCPEEAGDHAFALPGIAKDFLFSADPVLTEYVDGTAVMTGSIYDANDNTRSFDFVVNFSNRVNPTDPAYPPAGSPKKELSSSNYAPEGVVDTNSWHYYETVTGVLTGTNCFDGAVLNMVRTGPAFQIGVGASGKNTEYSGSGWFDLSLVSQPTGCDTLPTTSFGDINISISRCPEQ